MAVVSLHGQPDITGRTDDAPLPRNGISGYTLIGESRYKGGLIGTAQDKSGHLPQAAENDTIFAPQADGQQEENISKATPGAEETPGYENDEPDYEDEEIAGTWTVTMIPDELRA